MVRPGSCGRLLVFAIGLASSGGGQATTAHVNSSSDADVIKELVSGIPHSAFFGLSLDGGTGIAVGAGGAIAESVDGGVTWKPVPNELTQLSLLAVDRRGSQTIAVGQSGLVMVEGPTGKWAKIDTGSSGRLFSVSVNSKGLAVAVGQFGTVLKSDDGGRRWSSIAPDWPAFADPKTPGTDEPSLYSANVSESGEITIAGEFGVIMRSTNAGATWRVLRPVKPGEPCIFATSFPRNGVGNSYAVGQAGDLLISKDGGISWERRESTTKKNFLGVAAAPDGHVVITGMRVMWESLDNGATWTAVKEGDTTTDWYQSVRAEPSSGRILAVGHSGRIIQIVGKPAVTPEAAP